MNKIIMNTISAIALATAIVGCKSMPSDEQMYTTGYAGGAASGLIADMTKIDDDARATVIDIVKIVDTCIPATNQTFTEAWTPIAADHIAKLVEAGKIDAAQGVLIAKTFDIACNGIDYLFDVRWPQARQYQNLVEAATHGFCDGFLMTFKPANVTASPVMPVTIDQATYKHLAKKFLKK